MDEQKIRELAVASERARQTVEALASRNTYGYTAEEREQMAADYAVAQHRAYEAKRALDAAVSPQEEK